MVFSGISRRLARSEMTLGNVKLSKWALEVLLFYEKMGEISNFKFVQISLHF